MDGMEFRSKLTQLRMQSVHIPPPPPAAEPAPAGFLKHLGLEREQFDRDVDAIPDTVPHPMPADRERFHVYRQAMQAYWEGVRALELEEMERRRQDRKQGSGDKT